MFGLGLRRPSSPPPSERSRFVGASLTSTGIRAVLIGTGSVRSLQLDDPFLPVTLYTNSHTREDGSIVLLWNRQTR